MKNIITVNRINDKARRIYELPEDKAVKAGTLVQVETRFGDRLYGITTTDSALMDDTAVAIIRAALGMNPAGDFLPVKAVYGEPEEIQYPEDTEPDAGEDEPEDDETGEEE